MMTSTAAEEDIGLTTCTQSTSASTTATTTANGNDVQTYNRTNYINTKGGDGKRDLNILKDRLKGSLVAIITPMSDDNNNNSDGDIDININNNSNKDAFSSPSTTSTTTATTIMADISREVDSNIYKEPKIDFKAFDNLINWQIEMGTKGIVVMGTTGENPTVTDDEYIYILKSAVKTAAGRVPIIAGTSTNCTRSTICRTLLAASCGADGALIVTPYYNKPTQDGLFNHYSAVARACPDVPIILYNVPSRTGVDLLPPTIAKLSQVPNIIGTKEASGKVGRYKELMDTCKEGFMVFSGEDGEAIEAILDSNIHGVISVTANVLPAAVQKCCEFAASGQSAKARLLNDILSPLHRSLFVEPNPVPVKWLLSNIKRGEVPGAVRSPLLPLAAGNQEMLLNIYTAVCETMKERMID